MILENLEKLLPLINLCKAYNFDKEEDKFNEQETDLLSSN